MTTTPTAERGQWKPGAKLFIDITGAVPVPKGSMKGFVVKTKIGPRAIVTDSKNAELRAFERDVRGIAEIQMKQAGLVCSVDQPFEVLICYYLPRPRGDYDRMGSVKLNANARPSKKPDVDKLTRATLDSLTGIVWDDDSRIVRMVVEKRYATAKRDVGLWAEIRVLPSTMRDVAEELQLAV